MYNIRNDETKAYEKLKRIPVKIMPTEDAERKRLPREYYRKLPRVSEGSIINKVKKTLREHKLVSVCEEAACPNLSECFQKGTATYMIMGDKCTRRCSFCDVAHGKPDPLDTAEPFNLASVVKDMQHKYVVITSVDRDDLRDGGAGHFVACISEIRKLTPQVKIEILVPDFRGRDRMPKALEILRQSPPNVFNHNLETVPRLYKQARAGSDYLASLTLLSKFKEMLPNIPTKSGLMLGLGEHSDEIEAVLYDLRQHNVDMLTLGQYLQPSKYHMPIDRYASIDEFKRLAKVAKSMGFKNVASGPLVRSSYHADLQAEGDLIG